MTNVMTDTPVCPGPVFLPCPVCRTQPPSSPPPASASSAPGATYTVSTQYLHSIYTVFTYINIYIYKYLHIIYTVSTQYLHSIYTVSTQYLHSIYTVSTQYLHSMYRVSTQYVQSIYPVSTEYLPSIYTLSTVSAHRQPPVEDGVLVYGGDALRAPLQLVAALAGRQLGRGDHRRRGQLWSRE